MDKIILAYCRENAELAETIDRKLSRVGIPFEHVTNQPGAMPGQFAAWVQSTTAPVILIVTDNFLKSQSCMCSGLQWLQFLVKNNRVMPVVADGKIDRTGNGEFEATPTQFERVIHAIQYMNFWQSAYLELRSRQEVTADGEEAVSDDRLAIVRDISNEIGEFLNLLRDSGYVALKQFQANDFEYFFKKFGIVDWHPQYRQLAAFDVDEPMMEVFSNGLSTDSGNGTERSSQYAEAPHKSQIVENQQFEKPEPPVEIEKEAKPVPTPQAIVAPEAAPGGFENMDAMIEEILREEQDFSFPQAMQTEPGVAGSADPVEELFEDEPEKPELPPMPEHEVATAAETVHRVDSEQVLNAFFQSENLAAPAVEPEANGSVNFDVKQIPLAEKIALPELSQDEPDDLQTPFFQEKETSEKTENVVEWTVNQAVESDFQTEKTAPSEPISPQKSGLNDIALLINDAQFWIEKGYPDRAFQIFEMGLAANPENLQLRNAYLLAIAKTGRQADTIRQVESKLLSGEPQVYDLDLLGELALSKGDFLSAQKYWDRALTLDPHYPGLHLKLANLTDKNFKGSKRLAADYFKQAAEHEPDNADIFYRLGVIQLEFLDEPVAAIRNFLNVVALQKDHAGAWFDLAVAYRETGNPEKADTCFRRAALLSPDLKTEANERLFFYEEKLPEPPPVRKDALTVLITGATSGIGRATAEIFARNGHRLILAGRREERLEQIKDSFSKDYKNENLLLPFDVRDFKSAQTALENLPEAWQNVDVLLNNAGLAKGLDPIHEGSLEHWETMIDTNLKGLLYVTRLVSPGMVRRRRGHIINIGSSAGKEVYAKGNVYCATKFAVDALTRAMRIDLHAHNVRVSQVSPGHVEETEFAITRFDGDAERAKIYEDFQPLKASDVAEAIYFIATRPPHVNVQDIVMFASQQASATVIDRSGR